MNSSFIKQIALDYCCPEEWVTDKDNHFMVYKPLPGRRTYQVSDDVFLKVVAMEGKLLFTGREDIIEICRKKYEKAEGAWFMGADKLMELENMFHSYGYRIDMVHPFFLPKSGPEESEPLDISDFPYDIQYYYDDEIEQFRGDPRFDEAFGFSETSPDRIGVAALHDGEIIGMAGASSDGEYLWQIGINVDPGFRRQHVGSTLVGLLKEAVWKAGKTPFYGTAMWHVASQRTALSVGFEPVWNELNTKKIEEELTEDKKEQIEQKDKTEIVSRREKAEKNFLAGYNCAQSVVLAFADMLPMDKEMLSAMASSFGGGMGRLRETCGALTGIFMVVGLMEGYSGPETGEAKKAHYRKIQALGRQFEKDHEGTMICRELLHLTTKHDAPTPEARTNTYYEQRPCPRLVGDAAAMLEEFLKDEEGFISKHHIEL